jgi:hypothetical protein
VRTFALLAVAALLVSPAYAKTNTTTTLSSSQTTLVHGPTVTLTATVSGGTPTGTVTFYVFGTNSIGTGTVSNGKAMLSVPTADVPPNVYALSAKYGGDANDNGSTSGTLNLTVQTDTTTAFALSPTSIQLGRPVVFTATVARTGTTGYAAGSVTFSTNGAKLATATLEEGVARVTVPAVNVPLGSYPLVATYTGDAVDVKSVSATATATVTPAVDVLTFRNDVARTGVQPAETVLTTSNVNAATFGRLYNFTTDGYAFAQPLYVSNYTMNDGTSHNVLFVANATGTIYAFDADNNNPAAGYLWSISVIPAGESVVVPSDYYGCGNPSPQSGIIGTPTIDRALGVMYVIGKSKSVQGNTTTYIQRIHAINLADGTEKLNGPTIIQASVPGTGDGSVNGQMAFNSQSQNERAALVEANGSVWITWASHCDSHDYHGWTIGYNAADVSKQTGVYNNTPNGNQGGIWMVSGGISADNAGNLYTVAGNGTFDGNNLGGEDFSQTAQRLAIGAGTLSNGDWFTPTNEAVLSNADLDMGTADALLFDDPASGVAPHLLATADKTGRVYLLNRDSLGGFDSGPSSTNGDLQDFVYGSQIFTNFGYFNSRLYVGSGGQPLGAFDFTPGTGNMAGYLATTPSMTTPVTFSANYSNGGLQPVFSANGTSNAIVWGFDTSAQVLYAFDANNLSSELYSSATNASRDVPPAPIKFTVPVIANGHVFVAGQDKVSVYGLLP